MHNSLFYAGADVQSGFTLIEILIGVMLLSLAILTFSATLSQTYRWQIKQENYELINITANTLINTIVSAPEKSTSDDLESERGELNNIQYQWQCSPVLTGRNSEISSDVGSLQENTGKYNVFLERCILRLEMKLYKKKLQFFRSRYSQYQN